VEANKETVEEARRALAAIQRQAFERSTAVLTALATAKTEAEQAELLAEQERLGAVKTFDETTAAEVAALEETLRQLKAKRATLKGTLEGELANDRKEAAAQTTAATEAEAEIALAIAALRLGATAQDGLNDGLNG
jgi:hypothetical protein